MVKLVCAIVGVARGVFVVKIDAGVVVRQLKKAIKDEKPNQITCDADELQLFLAKKDEGRGPWLTEEEAKQGVSGTTGLKLLGEARQEIGDAGLSEDDVRLQVTKHEVADLKGLVNVLVVVPEVESKRPAMEVLPLQSSVLGVAAEYQWKNLLNALEWRESRRLCGSTKQDWPYQGASELVAELTDPLIQHYNVWQDGEEDKQKHAVNLVLSGPGTGKSRMLDEMKGLLGEAARRSKKEDLVERMENAYVFPVTFENGTAATGRLLDSESPEFDVSYRMLYQIAKERTKNEWTTFALELKRSYSNLPLTIGKI